MYINKTSLFKLLIAVLFCKSMNGFSQATNDSLRNKSYQSLIKGYHKNIKDEHKANIYASELLKKARKGKDSLKIGVSFYLLSSFKKDSFFLDYCDSIIYYTKALKTKNNIYPMIGYYNKGDYFYKTRKFNLALKNYLLAYNATTNKTPFYFNLKHRIGLLKTRFGNDKEALELFKDANNYYIQQQQNTALIKEYLPVLFALTDSYLRNNHIDSSKYYNAIGLKKSYIHHNGRFYNYFRFEQGLIEYKSKNYQKAIDSIKKSMPLILKIKDFSNASSGNYYIGRAYEKLNNVKLAVIHFKKVDSIFQITKDIHPDLVGGYEYLIKYYHNNQDLSNELIYVKKLLEVDKNLNGKKNIINKALVNQYDTPKLISTKNQLIAKINHQSHLKSITIYLFSIISIVLCVLIIHQFQKRKKYKKHFEKLMSPSDKEKELNRTNIQVPQKVIENVLKNLSVFEEDQLFLDRNMSQVKLATYLNTNTNYLSLIINAHKHKNYKNYLNELRIDYIINELKEKKVYRNYTIKALTEIAGFKNSESFSKAFYKKTGIYPSYFIKNLQKY